MLRMFMPTTPLPLALYDDGHRARMNEYQPRPFPSSPLLVLHTSLTLLKEDQSTEIGFSSV